MSVIATAVEHLLAAGVTGDALVRAIAAMEAATDTRSTGAKRQQRYRDRKAGKRNEASQSVTSVTSDASAPPPNDIYSNPPPEPLGAKAPSTPFSEKVVEAWNDGPAKRGATKARKLDASRKKLLAARVREHGEDGVLLAIRGIEISDFHCGIGPNSFVSNLGWLLKSPEKFVAAMERAEAAKSSDAPKAMNGEQSAAYLAGIADKPWMRGRENELALQPRASGPPRTFAQLAGGIAGAVMVQ